nr:hypothetical protein [uncultured Dorea sp.]
MKIKFGKRKRFCEIGKREYDFDYEKEKRFYSYLCFQKTKKKKFESDLQKLNKGRKGNEQYTFESYTNWKKYIVEKYKSDKYSLETLIDFSAYLNWGSIRLHPGREGWSILSAAYVTLLFTEISKLLIPSCEINSITWVLIMLIILIPLVYIVTLNVLSPIYDNNIVENMYIDYKKVIDELIEERKQKNSR